MSTTGLRFLFSFLGLLALPAFDRAQTSDVTARVEIQSTGTNVKSPLKTENPSDVVVWLKPLDAPVDPVPASQRPRPQLIQKNKTFDPHLLVVRVGSTVDFPNKDPFFHNVFSLFDGKRFDLGLYEAGTTHSVRFDRPGVSFLFCNIHPEMSAVVVAVDTPYYAVTTRTGALMIPHVPDGRYELHVWYERSLPEDLRGLTRTVSIASESSNLGTIRVPLNPSFTLVHKNKYGQDYATPPDNSTTYSHP